MARRLRQLHAADGIGHQHRRRGDLAAGRLCLHQHRDRALWHSDEVDHHGQDQARPLPAVGDVLFPLVADPALPRARPHEMVPRLADHPHVSRGAGRQGRAGRDHRRHRSRGGGLADHRRFHHRRRQGEVRQRPGGRQRADHRRDDRRRGRVSGHVLRHRGGRRHRRRRGIEGPDGPALGLAHCAGRIVGRVAGPQGRHGQWRRARPAIERVGGQAHLADLPLHDFRAGDPAARPAADLPGVLGVRPRRRLVRPRRPRPLHLSHLLAGDGLADGLRHGDGHGRLHRRHPLDRAAERQGRHLFDPLVVLFPQVDRRAVDRDHAGGAVLALRHRLHAQLVPPDGRENRQGRRDFHQPRGPLRPRRDRRKVLHRRRSRARRRGRAAGMDVFEARAHRQARLHRQ